MKTFNYKLVILVRDDLNMSKGKLAVQCSHTTIEAVLNSNKKIVDEWRKEGMKKVILKVDNLENLRNYENLARKEKLKAVLIKDAGLTEFKNTEITCLGIGPDKEGKIDKITGKLKLL